jgi:hypothetical protein
MSGTGADRETWARVAFGVTSIVVTAGLVLQLVLAVGNDNGRFAGVADRVVNVLSFFTIQSNIIVAVTTALLAMNLHRRSTVFRVFRLCGVIGIAITGIVFHIAIASLHELSGFDALADFVLHTFSPVACVLGWLVFGPRRQTSLRIVGYAVIFPVVWLIYTMIRGAIVEDRFGKPYYPYEFLRVDIHGYAYVAVAAAIVAVLFFVLSFGAVALDRRLPGIEAEPAP